MFTVTIESSPLDGGFASCSPIEVDLSSLVSYEEISAFETRWETNDQGTNLGLRTGSVNMATEEPRWP